MANGQYPANGDQGPTYSFLKQRKLKTKHAASFAAGWAVRIKGSPNYR